MQPQVTDETDCDESTLSQLSALLEQRPVTCYIRLTKVRILVMDQDLSRLEATLKQYNAGNFIEAVSGARDKADNTVIMTLRAFYREPELLYTALAYASARGVAVTMAPEHEEADYAFEY